MQIAAITGLGGAAPTITDCRPPQQQQGDCCCTIIVLLARTSRPASMPSRAGWLCASRPTVARSQELLRIARGSIVLKAESPGTTVRSTGNGPPLIIGNPAGIRIEGIDVLGIDFEANNTQSILTPS
ncbi:MAG: hypothetical protein U1E67_12965 [Hyphomicrobiales bacterium]